MKQEIAAPSSPGAVRAALALGVALLLCFSAAAVGALFLPGEWYHQLRKPSWNPPTWIFGPVWTLLYTMMAIAAWLVWRRGGFRAQQKPLTLFLLQLLFNAAWSPLFFGLHSPGMALIDIVLLWISLFATVLAFWKMHRVTGALLVPYLLWVTFAAVLNGALWRLNV